MERNENLQAVRGITALVVMGTHLPYAFGREEDFPHVVMLGRIAVFVFFFLSGIVIAAAHEGEAFGAGPRGWRPFLIFAAKRFFRLYPILFVSVTLAFLIQGDAPAQYLSSLSPIPIGEGRHLQILGPVWSLYHEVFFYGVFGMLLLWRPLGRIACFGVVAGTLIQIIRGGDLLVFSHLNFYFASGAALFLLRKRLPRLPLATIILAAAPFAAAQFAAGGLARTAFCLAACGLLFVPLIVVWDHRVPGVFLYLGEISYPLYLIHLPILVGLMRIRPFESVFGMAFLLIAASLAAATLLNRWVERPGIALGAAWLRRWHVGRASRNKNYSSQKVRKARSQLRSSWISRERA